MSYFNEHKTVSTSTNSIVFNELPPLPFEYNKTCIMTIIVEEKVYNNVKGTPHVYCLNYSYKFIEPSGKEKTYKSCYKLPGCPFFGMKDAESHFQGTIVYKNEMIDKMIEFILFPLEELKQYSGTTHPQQYIKQIIQTISYF